MCAFLGWMGKKSCSLTPWNWKQILIIEVGENNIILDCLKHLVTLLPPLPLLFSSRLRTKKAPGKKRTSSTLVSEGKLSLGHTWNGINHADS